MPLVDSRVPPVPNLHVHVCLCWFPNWPHSCLVACPSPTWLLRSYFVLLQNTGLAKKSLEFFHKMVQKNPKDIFWATQYVLIYVFCQFSFSYLISSNVVPFFFHCSFSFLLYFFYYLELVMSSLPSLLVYFIFYSFPHFHAHKCSCALFYFPVIFNLIFSAYSLHFYYPLTFFHSQISL